jgi:ketosteroid isomerase-like protein
MTSPDETERNRTAITATFEAWRDDGAPITDSFAPEMIWRIEGHSAASRAYPNEREFIDEVLAPFGQRFSTSDPFRPVSIRGVENSYAWFMQMRDGKVIDGTAFYDSISFNELWTKVTPRPLR